MHIEFEAGYDSSLCSRLLVYNAILHRDHQLPVISLVVYPFHVTMAQSPFCIRHQDLSIVTFHFQTLPLFTLDAQRFVREHQTCIYPLLLTMEGVTAELIDQSIHELARIYDDVTLSQQLIWMKVFLDRTETIDYQEKLKIQEKLAVFDQLIEQNPTIQRMRAESRLKGRQEGQVIALRDALVDIVELKFPELVDYASQQAHQFKTPEALHLLIQQIKQAPDTNAARAILNSGPQQ